MSSQQAATSAGAPAAASDSGLKIWSCVICRRRKVRCDRRDPCANCVKGNIECHYPVTGRIPRRTRDPTAWKSPSQKQSELLSRLRRLETVVTELAAQVEDGSGSGNRWHTPSTSTSSGPGSSTHVDDNVPGLNSTSQTNNTSIMAAGQQPGSEFDEDFGRLVIDKDGGLHVGNRFWGVFCGEVDNILQAIHDVAEYEGEPGALPPMEDAAGGTIPSRIPQNFVFSDQDYSSSLDDFSPLPSQMLFIWQTYQERVDPFIKILHVDTTAKIIHGLGGNQLSTLGLTLQPLIFSLSLATIISMKEAEVTVNFGAPKDGLLSRYRFGTEQALARADFLTSKDINVLQAFVIYLTILPYLGAGELSWTLIGSVLRLAKRMGLHQEVGHPEEKPLDSEIRRRLWWQICFLDSRSRNPAASDLSLSNGGFSTQMPSNIDDRVLTQGLSQTPEPAPSGLTLCLIRCELWKLVRMHYSGSITSTEARIKTLHGAQSRVMNKYIRQLRPDVPFEAFLKTLTDLFFAKVELLIYRSRFKQSKMLGAGGAMDSTTDLLVPATTVIEAAYKLKTEPTWVKWQWQLEGSMPWHAMFIVLGHASCRPWSPAFERRWDLISKHISAASPEVKTGPLWEHVEALMEKCRSHRDQQQTKVILEGNGALENDSSTEIVAHAVQQEITSSHEQSQLFAGESIDPTADSYVPTGDLTMPPSSFANFEGLEPMSTDEIGDLMNWESWDDMDSMDQIWNFTSF